MIDEVHRTSPRDMAARARSYPVLDVEPRDYIVIVASLVQVLVPVWQTL